MAYTEVRYVQFFAALSQLLGPSQMDVVRSSIALVLVVFFGIATCVAAENDDGGDVVQFRLSEDLAGEGDSGQEIVTRIPFLFEDFLVLGEDFSVEFGREVWRDRYVAVGYERGHLCVGESMCVVGWHDCPASDRVGLPDAAV